MRVISGQYGGRKLVSFKADHVRPTTDQVKEVIFNKIQGYLPEARVLDLYGGTGSLAIEALSRGADFVCSVESHRKSLQIMEKNRQLIGIGEEWAMLQLDVFRFLKKPSEPFDIILVDPPFTKKIAHDTMVALSESTLFHDETEIFIESSAQEQIEDDYGQSIHLKSRKNFGDKYLSHYIIG